MKSMLCFMAVVRHWVISALQEGFQMRHQSSCRCLRVAGVNVVRIVFAPSLHAHRAETRLTVYRAHPH